MRLSALLLFFLPLVGCSEIQWERDYATGMQRAAREQKRALVEFTTAWSADARTMEESFADPEVLRLMKQFVPIRLDGLFNKDIADQFAIQTIPSYLVLRPDGSLAGGETGPMNADRFRIFLIKHSFD